MQKSPTFCVWDDFLQKVLLPVKQYLAATQNADWMVYQESKLTLLHLLFCSNRLVYSRYMPVTLLLMKRLPQEVRDDEGLFVARLAYGVFNGVLIDYAIEKSSH
jgi:hypothetical protein